ncbi:MAG: diacylglycerol/lipid kinase family protein [bacterium]
MSRKIKLVVNPVAGNYTVAKNWSDLCKTLKNVLGDFSAEFTKDILDATTITRRALLEGYETIVALGGDGTINEVVNGFFKNDKLINPQASFGVIAMGTGGDWVKSFETPANLDHAASLILDHRITKCDVGLLKCQGLDGYPVSRYFMNVADAGFGGTSAQLVNKSTKALGPFFAYLTGLLRTLAVYKNKPIQIEIDDSYAQDQIANSVVIANGQFFGGGMWIAPQAKIDDGLFEVVIIGDVSKTEVLANIYRLYNGTLAKHPKVQSLQGKKVTLNSDSEVLIEADGEQPGKLPATFEILSRVLNCIC